MKTAFEKDLRQLLNLHLDYMIAVGTANSADEFNAEERCAQRDKLEERYELARERFVTRFCREEVPNNKKTFTLYSKTAHTYEATSFDDALTQWHNGNSEQECCGYAVDGVEYEIKDEDL